MTDSLLTDRVPLDDTVLTLEPRPRLRASRCSACEHVDFPARDRCTRCRAAAAPHALPARGTIWTWTTQNFAPVTPPYAIEGAHTPFVVGYVDLDGCCVETRLDLPDGRDPVIGEEVELVALPVRIAGAGDVLTYAFGPVGGGA